MDQHGEKEETNSQESASAADRREETAAAEGEDSQESASAADQREGTAAAEGEDTSEESMDQRKEDGYKADESTGLVEDDVVGSGEASAPLPFAHPWSLLRACAACLGLLGCCGDQQPPPAEAATAAAVAARSYQEEETGGEKAAKANAPPPQGFYMQEVITRVWAVTVAVRTPRPPDHAREGSGGHGGAHH